MMIRRVMCRAGRRVMATSMITELLEMRQANTRRRVVTPMYGARGCKSKKERDWTCARIRNSFRIFWEELKNVKKLPDDQNPPRKPTICCNSWRTKRKLMFCYWARSIENGTLHRVYWGQLLSGFQIQQKYKSKSNDGESTWFGSRVRVTFYSICFKSKESIHTEIWWIGWKMTSSAQQEAMKWTSKREHLSGELGMPRMYARGRLTLETTRESNSLSSMSEKQLPQHAGHTKTFIYSKRFIPNVLFQTFLWWLTRWCHALKLEGARRLYMKWSPVIMDVIL